MASKKHTTWTVEARVFMTVESDKPITKAQAEASIYAGLVEAVQEYLDEEAEATIESLKPAKGLDPTSRPPTRVGRRPARTENPGCLITAA